MPLKPRQFIESSGKVFKEVAKDIWKSLGDRHRLGLKWGETGITEEIVYRIAKAAENNSEVQAEVKTLILEESRLEKHYGHDIDLIVQIDSDAFLWFALQAKVMSPNSVYQSALHHLSKKARTNSGVTWQWELLKKGFDSKQWLPFYLLYNGFADKERSQETQLGCSALSLKKFIKLTCDNKTGNPKKHPSGKNIHPEFGTFHVKSSTQGAFPWHKLLEKAAHFRVRNPKITLLTESSIKSDVRYKSLEVANGALKQDAAGGTSTLFMSAVNGSGNVNNGGDGAGYSGKPALTEIPSAAWRIIIRSSSEEERRKRREFIDRNMVNPVSE